MFKVIRIDKKDDNSIYDVYSVKSKFGRIFFLTIIDNKLKWIDSAQVTPYVSSEQTQRKCRFIDTNEVVYFQAIEVVYNHYSTAMDSTNFNVIYFSKNGKWYSVPHDKCIILDE